jgi:FlaA1/EpsC-like NDP-sugar epimerase
LARKTAEKLSENRPAWHRLLAVYFAEAIAMSNAAVAAFLLRFDFSIPSGYVGPLMVGMAVWVPVKLISFGILGMDRRWARYVSITDLLRLLSSNLAGSLVSLVILNVAGVGIPRTVYAIDFLLSLCLTGGMRVAVRLSAESMRRRSFSERRTRALIYGAGDAGAALLRDIRQNNALNYDVCAFIDDNPKKLGLVLHGVKVVANGDDLEEAARKFAVEVALIAIPSASGAQMKQILEKCTAGGVRSKTIPGLAELIDDKGLARQIRDVAVEDLLGRTPVHLDQDLISAKLRGRVIMVTGAAGSIGSEICRQIARFEPEAIIGFEIAESPLFSLQMELARTFPHVTFHAEIGSIQNAARLAEVFERHHPSAVYHAAAYKHVPMMEAHPFEALENNVFGTLNLVEQARAHRVAEFVMISSDKAVRPANIMGATKRLAEVLVRALRPVEGRYVSVRFGNVLGSNGSVVPIFKEQIARGGPVTITHPEMRRFFMTIPEACQLVLQASTMGRGGEIFVLDMGEPVKIVDLARNLILLSGLRPDTDVKISYTGTRPGEKLFEELNEETEGLLETHHEKIRIFEGQTQPVADVERQLARLRLSCRERDGQDVLKLLKGIVPEYTPADELMRRSEGRAAANT